MSNDIEVTQRFKCPVCGNDREFTGEYRHGVIYQDFTYSGGVDVYDGVTVHDVDYEAFRDEDLGHGFDTIWCASQQCATNNVVVWERAK